jgi:hypothetical protein
MQCTWLLLSHFHCHQHCPVVTNKQRDYQASVSTIPTHSTRGIQPPADIHHLRTTLRSQQGWVCLWFLCFSPLFPMFSHCSLFRLNFSSVVGIDYTPSVHKGKTSPHLLSPTHECHRETNNSEFVYCLYSPHIPNIFSPHPFSINLLFCWQCRPPSLSRQGK